MGRGAAQSYWAALGLPALLQDELWDFMGEGIVQLTPPPASKAVVTVTRIVADGSGNGGTKEIWVTRLHSGEGGNCSFASLNGTHIVTAVLSDGSVHKAQVELVARARTRIVVPVG